jgi:protein tyrosine phosphatase
MIAPKRGGFPCAGIGRTGTFCAVDIALQRLRSGDYGVAVSAAELKPVVAELRRQRAGMVQTAEQYLFCYRVRFTNSSEKRLAVTSKAFEVQYFGRLSLPASL